MVNGCRQAKIRTAAIRPEKRTISRSPPKNRWGRIPALSGVEGKVDVDQHCYLPMDRLLERQSAIQRTLAARHLQDGHLVLYDITSSYFEGAYTQSDIVTFGYNRDGKRGHEQMVIALLCSAEGCPVGVEVFAGNTQDAATVPEKIAQLQRQYGLKEIIFVGDRGMITKTVTDKIKGIEGLHTISALTHRQIVELLERKVITAELLLPARAAKCARVRQEFQGRRPRRGSCRSQRPLRVGARHKVLYPRLGPVCAVLHQGHCG
jgi:hypothetical protein